MARRRGGGRRGGPRKKAKNRERKPKQDVDPAEQCVEVSGTIAAVLAGTMFRVTLDNSEHTILAHISGKMRKRFIRLVIGDRVKLEMSPYDPTKGRIVYRLR
ncbi:MAG: translation initiation factor IF-1 [Verrucomicrobiota bacterium]